MAFTEGLILQKLPALRWCSSKGHSSSLSEAIYQERNLVNVGFYLKCLSCLTLGGSRLLYRLASSPTLSSSSTALPVGAHHCLQVHRIIYHKKTSCCQLRVSKSRWWLAQSGDTRSDSDLIRRLGLSIMCLPQIFQPCYLCSQSFHLQKHGKLYS